MDIISKVSLMKHKNLILISVLSLLACGLHAAMLNSPFNGYLYTSILKVVVFILFPLICFAVSKSGSFKDLIFLKGEKKYIKICLFLGIFVFAFILTVFILFNKFFDKMMIVDGMSEIGITKTTYPLVFIYIILINSALEELFFRGFAFLTLYKLGYKRYAYIFSSLLFAGYHMAVLDGWFSIGIFILCIAGLVAVGLIFNEFAKRCRTILGSFLLHVSANLAINLIGAYYFYLA